MKTARSILLVLLLAFVTIDASAQIEFSTSAINAGGTDFRNDQFYLTSSIGEMAAIHTVFVTDLILSNGVLQPSLRRITPGNSSSVRFLYLYPTLTRDNFVYFDAAVMGKASATITTYTITGQLISRISVIIDPSVYHARIPLTSTASGEFVIDVAITGDQFSVPFKKSFRVQRL
ncbi:MAG: hypothetical protein H7Y31_13795 [Chitinophagaceae bacterium]|nr:hypothetical protein [Chitinophagaceae bacterium]